jgi:photosystem II stability/assembly factor-like uncharacterized protein
MKKIIVFFFISFLLSSISIAQSSWQVLNSGSSANLSSISFVNVYTGYVSGNSIVLKTTNQGINWNTISTPSMVFYSIYFVNEMTGYAASPNGYVYKTTNGGYNWFQNYYQSTGFASIFFLSQSTGYATGYSGVIIKTTNAGVNWVLQNSGVSIDLYQIFCIDTLNCYAVGNAASGGSSKILKTTNGGTNWNIYDLPSVYALNGDCFINYSTGYAVGIYGSGQVAILKTTNAGSNWFVQDNSSGSQLFGVAVSSDFGFVVGGGGLIKKTYNAGANWLTDTSNTGSLLYCVKLVGNAFYASGQNGVILKNNALLNHAKLNNVEEYIGRTTSTNITLNDSMCTGLVDSAFWYVNDSLVSKQHSMTYNYTQGTKIVKLILRNNTYFWIDTTTARVSVGVWKKYTNGQILAGLSLIGDSVLYAISTGDKIYKMDINGNTLLTIQVNGNILSSCSVTSDTTIFIGSSDNNLYGFNRYGFSLWPAYPCGGSVSTTPTIDSISNRIYVGVENGNFAAINKSTGTLAWGYPLNVPIKSSAVISFDRKLVCATAVGTVYGFNLNLSTPYPPSWTLSLNDSVLVSPCIDTSGYFYFGSRSGKIYKVALTGTNTSTIIWQTPLASAVTSSPTIDVNGNIYVGTADGKFYSLNKSGSIRWFFQSPAQIKSTAAITSYQRIYFGNDAGEIYGLDTNKIVRFYYIDSAKISCAMLHHNGTLYFGNEAGRLFALYDSTGGSKGPGIPVWGTFQNNPRRTGDQSNKIPIPSVPILLSPPNGLSGLSLTPLLDWNDAPYALKFRVQLATDSLFGGIVYDTSNVYISQLTVPVGKLSFNTKYFWRVNAQNATGTSSWSGAWWFTTAVSVPAPQLISPLNLTIGVSLTPLLYWSSIPSAVGYRLQVSTTSGFTTNVLDSTVYTTAVMVSTGMLGSITQYYWRVASISTAGQGSFCSHWSFTTRNNLILNLKTYLEGFWNGSTMVPDTARIYIASASSPYGFLDSTTILLSATATATATFGLPPNGNYYVVVIHRNHLETWSRLTQNFITDVPVNYNFTTDSAKAYGFNMKKVGNDWVLIGGDENQDGSIDAIDVSDLIIQYGNIGYLSCDFNGDGSVDAADVPYMIDNYGLTKVVPTLESLIKFSERKKIITDKIKKEKTEQKKVKKDRD